MNLNELTIHELRDKLAAGETTALAIAEAVFRRIDAVESKIHAFISLMRESALEEAAAADRRIAAGDATDLTGIPIAVKDVLCTKGSPTTCGSRILENFVPPYDATVIAKLKAAGAVIIGKTNMDEFAMGSSTERSAFGLTRNPWDLERIPGGSSGGSAAAMAADECIAAIGTDTGGSIRQPASLCGVVGLKPTYGLVSRYGLVAFASSLDQIGPFAKDAEDCAIMLNALAGHDPKDSTSVPAEAPDYRMFPGREAKGWTVGIPKEYFVEGIDPEISAAVNGVIATLERLGVAFREVSLPRTKYCVAVYYIIAPSEASSNLARYDGVRYGFRSAGSRNLIDMFKQSRLEGFGSEVKRRIMIGTYSLSAGYYDAYYKKASQVRTLMRQDFDEAFKTCDALVTPVTPTPAFRIGEKMDDPIQMYLSDIFTLSTNLAGLPGISVPCGYTTTGLPIGVQFMARHFDEGKLLTIASALERETPFEKRRPAL
ncbi:MAG: Asp-tRNA(Asn)/Glu-tRNA(Gln) amidotransferase subunit GatA [Deltaproteobacteria bacterium]|nr:Asp-tRNA(Asn)/Glu-tRNA(Gln) amidotransferase subunit GatA [Deltaproteobacteria bacterium]